MSILTVTKLNYYAGVEPILEDITFNVNKGERIGIVGVNGAGKSTLLKLIVGEYQPEDGDIAITRGTSIGYLRQREHFDGGQTVLDVMENVPADVKAAFAEEHGYDYSRAVIGILTSMGFGSEYHGRDVGLLSGGEKTRLALCALLVREPDILLLDEPTNHLDIPTLKWLENYLRQYRGTLMIVSHDRYFLDRCVTRILEIENCGLKSYNGNYSSYKEQKQRNYEIDLKHYEHQMEEIERQEEIIRRFKEHNTEHLVKRAQSREKRLAHIVRPVKPTMLREQLKVNFDQKLQSGNDVVKVMDLSFGYSTAARGTQPFAYDALGISRQAQSDSSALTYGSTNLAHSSANFLFKNVNLDIKRGERVCIVGSNGVGKTTLLKILLGELMPKSGRVILGTNVIPGYYDQEQQNLHPDKTVLDEIHSEYRKYNAEDLRKILGGFLFHGDDVFKSVKDLAGGEKARLSLLKLMMSGCNLLIFDEPTNHLDISAKEVFEEAISAFPGTVIIVSHDRYLLQRVPTYIIELTPDGATKYLGNYDYFEEKSAAAKAKPSKLGDNASGNNVNNNAVARNTARSAVDACLHSLAEQVDEPGVGNTGGANSGSANAGGANASSRQETWEEKKAREREERKAKKALETAEARVNELEAQVAQIEAEIAKPGVASNAAKLAELAGTLEQTKADLETAYEAWMELQ